MHPIDTVGRQIVLNAPRSMVHEAAAFRYLMGKGLNESDIKMILRKVGVFTKIRIHKDEE